MKKILKTFFILVLLSARLFASDCDLKNVPENFLGTYMPVHMELLMKQNHSYVKSLNAISALYYDILILNQNICYSSIQFEDQYAVRNSDFQKWSFIEKGDDRILIDENGLSYRRISTNYDEGYKMYAQRVVEVLCHDALQNKNFKMNDYTLTIYGKKYDFQLNTYYSSDPCTLVLADKNKICFLQREGLGAKIYNSVQGENKMIREKGTDVLLSIPLFAWDDESYPNIEVYTYKDSKEDLRLLRNLVFAKHGYKFKSEDLQKIFNQFEWYKENPNFSENDFSPAEKELIEIILRYENN